MTLNATLKIILPLLMITASAKAQNISLDGDSVDVSLLLFKIQSQSGKGLNISPDALEGAKKVTIHVKNKPLHLVLEEICKGQPFRFIPDSKFIVIVRRSLAEDPVKRKRATFYWVRFVDPWGEGVESINVYSSDNKYVATSDHHGKFSLRNARAGNSFWYESPEVDSGTFTLGTRKDFPVRVKYRAKEGIVLRPIDVISTGIQQIAKKLYVGSSFVLPASVIQQRTALSILDRLEGISPGLLLSVNKVPNTYQPKYLSLGGRSTIFSGADPMIVVNGFPFIGRFEDLNPDDLENITFLRDASATALWGALSGNSVLVVTNKSGKFNHPKRVSFNTYVRVGSKPDAFAKDILSPSNRFYLDSLLARSDYYTPLIRNPAYPYVPELALRILNNSISEAEMATLKNLDVRNDLNKYFYRTIAEKHLTLQVTGGNDKHAYFISAGADHSLPELKLSNMLRFNLNVNYNTRPIDGLEVSTIVASTYNKEHNAGGEPRIPVTYASLTDASGEPAAMGYQRNMYFIDSAGRDANGQRKLRDWLYRPLKEFRIRDNDRIHTDHRIQLSAKYNKFEFLKGLEAGLYAQYEIAGSENYDIKDKDGYYANDLINSYTQVHGNTVVRPIPVGNILDYSMVRFKTLNLRAQLSYAQTIGKSSSISILVGSDRIHSRGKHIVKRVYDYTRGKPEGVSDLNYQTGYRQYYFPAFLLPIPNPTEGKRTTNHYISYYANLNLQLKGKYYASIAARSDRSNIFGSKTNTGFKPLGSVGAAWDISAEDFFHPRIFEFLKLRSSIGLSGNPPLGVSAIQTISMAGKNEHGDIIADINNPSLPSLRWEKILTYNAGFNFRLKKQVIEGTIDYYFKKSTDLIGHTPADPSVGAASIIGNVASMKSHSVDLTLTTKNINRMLRWGTVFLLSYVKDYVTKTDTTRQPAWAYCDLTRFSVVKNRPLYGIYSFPSIGLDEHGDPVGPDKNKDYQSTVLSPGTTALNYRGRSTPPVFGSITNDFTYKQFGLSFTFVYKFNYYYRKPSVNYTGIFEGTDPGSNDFSKRWEKKGDEDHTVVPKMLVPANPFRDYFFIYSAPLVKRADFIRLQNIHFSYDIEGEFLQKIYLRSANFYINCSNAGIVWRATKSKLDPDRLQGFPNPTMFSFGFKGIIK